MLGKKRFRTIANIFWGLNNSKAVKEDVLKPARIKKQNEYFSQPSVYHALIVIFLEFFSWGLVMSPVITVLNEIFPEHAFLMNGLIQGVKGLLSFLSAPLIGALSDTFGRRPFLILTVFFTCIPIPLMKISPMWYFALMSLSGIFAATFSIVFAYVADITLEEDRSAAYGLVSATFAASLVVSPAIGAYLGKLYSDNMVVALATAVALLDVLFVAFCVPESLHDKSRTGHRASASISWEKADPFGALRRIGQDFLILMLCVTVFFSYLPEAGEYSSFFVYLRLVLGFSAEEVASFVAFVGILSVIAQTAILALMMKYIGMKNTILVGLLFEMIQLFMLGFGSKPWIIWSSGALAAMCSITYPSISAFVSAHASDDQQGVAQGIVTGIRGLCNGLGPAIFGFIFYLFHVDLNEPQERSEFAPTSVYHLRRPGVNKTVDSSGFLHQIHETIMPGPPFAFGAILVILALIVALFIPENPHAALKSPTTTRKCTPVFLHRAESSDKDTTVYRAVLEHVPLMTESECET